MRPMSTLALNPSTFNGRVIPPQEPLTPAQICHTPQLT